jgi:hypothetical protein
MDDKTIKKAPPVIAGFFIMKILKRMSLDVSAVHKLILFLAVQCCPFELWQVRLLAVHPGAAWIYPHLFDY